MLGVAGYVVAKPHWSAGVQTLPEVHLGCAREPQGAKAAGREAGQEGGGEPISMNESASEAAAVIVGSKQVASNRPVDWAWVDRSIWTERMLAALEDGVRGGMARCLLRCCGASHLDQSPASGEPIPMRKPPTGEPYAGEPHVRFGGRGGDASPTPIRGCLTPRPDPLRAQWGLL